MQYHRSGSRSGDPERVIWWEVQDIHLDRLENGLGTEALGTAQVAQLAMIAQGSGVGSSQARAWLAALGDSLEADIVLPSLDRSFQQFSGSAMNTTDPELLGVYPNPSEGEAYLTYRLPDGSEAAELQIFDATGRMVWQRNTGRSSGVTELPTGLTAGLYQVVLRSRIGFVASVKFTISR